MSTRSQAMSPTGVRDGVRASATSPPSQTTGRPMVGVTAGVMTGGGGAEKDEAEAAGAGSEAGSALCSALCSELCWEGGAEGDGEWDSSWRRTVRPSMRAAMPDKPAHSAVTDSRGWRSSRASSRRKASRPSPSNTTSAPASR
ncbi:hypothetical protein ACFJIX_16300 [Roseateles sp. UC29_93]|uniref:hypothetical protein n=1 Tax=Roseateles sp. UC29_93 TaxID=3350177 RepID=UPI00366ABFFD